MAIIIEDTAGRIRSKPISLELKRLLLRAAEMADVDIVRVTSGGQAPKGSRGNRIGSTRHDYGHAADLELKKNGRTLKFKPNSGRPVFIAFVTAAAALGATGIGAGIKYMGPTRLHIGYGKKAYWGKGGKRSNAPKWLKKAAQAGWNNPVQFADDDMELFKVIARNGLYLRQGPKRTFPASELLMFGSTVHLIEKTNNKWWLVDLEGDGRADGHVHRSYLRSV